MSESVVKREHFTPIIKAPFVVPSRAPQKSFIPEPPANPISAPLGRELVWVVQFGGDCEVFATEAGATAFAKRVDGRVRQRTLWRKAAQADESRAGGV